MRKLIFLPIAMMLFASPLVFLSCSNYDEDNSKESLEGIELTCASSEEFESLNFVSDTNVDCYITRDGAVSGKVNSGTYMKWGDEDIFSNLNLVHDCVENITKSSKISGKTNVTYDCGANGIDICFSSIIVIKCILN